MSKVILQPAGSKDAKRHYIDTVETPVDINVIRRHVNNDIYKQLLEIYPDGRVPTWGVVPGTNNGSVKKWERIETGDVTLFARQSKIFASAVVTLKIRNEALALELWGRDKKGQAWEYMYFVDEKRRQDIPYPRFNSVVGYKTNNVIQGFNVLTEDQSRLLFDTFDLESAIHLPDITEEEFDSAVDALEGYDDLDLPSKVNGRKEQSFLRRHLFEGKIITQCGLCNENLPVSFLVAAHIKKRSQCSLEEKKDYQSIVMPMCKFGCDELFEQGYIGVRDGKVIQIKEFPITEKVEKHVKKIGGNICSYWNESTSVYFDWHFNYHKK